MVRVRWLLLVAFGLSLLTCRGALEPQLDCARSVIAGSLSSEPSPEQPNAFSLHLGPPNVSIPGVIMASEFGESLELRFTIEEFPGVPFADPAYALGREVAGTCNVPVAVSVINQGVPEMIRRGGLGYVE